MNVRPCGPLACLVDCDSDRVLSVALTLRESGLFVEVVPAETSVLVSWTSQHAVAHSQILALAESAPMATDTSKARHIEIPVRYDGPDLEDVARATDMSVNELITLHTSTTFYAAFAGFAPGFIYCIGLPKQLILPRRPTPRIAVPAGSVAIADGYSAVYPLASPGGWNLLGTTDVAMFDMMREPASFVQPGDTVRYRAVTR